MSFAPCNIHVVEGLQPFTEYEFHVQTFGVTGDGPRSVVVSIITNPMAPSSPPQNFRVDHVSLHEVPRSRAH